MSDFIFSTGNIERNKTIKEIQSIYREDLPFVKEYRGEWGTLGVSKNLYNGFEPYENTQYITVVIGGPILMFRDNCFLNNEGSFEGTKATFQRWKDGEMNWDEDLNGPFTILIINKETKEVTCITDLMSFIPVYSFINSKEVLLATHVDVVARITKQNKKIDKVSLADFILNGVVTFPYTRYTHIFQVEPASVHTIESETTKLKSSNYWLPIEEKKYKSINEASNMVRKSLQLFIKKVTTETTNIAQFISGGEDSRMLSGLLKDFPRDAYIFLDGMNREGLIAKKVANIYGGNLKLSTRHKMHYLNILPSCSDLVGSGSQYHHAHTYGFHNTCNLNSYTAVLGGLFSDALLKGARIKKVKGSKRFPFLPDIKKTGFSKNTMSESTFFRSDVLSELTIRQQAHLKYIKTIRKESAEEWFELWPSSMNHNIPNIHANRRLFRSYEPFMSAEIVKISAAIPQKWKLNRRLFHQTAKPYLRPSKWLFHGDGWLPYFPWFVNSIVQFITWSYRHVAKRIGLIKGNQGPWAEWKKMIHSTEWEETIEIRQNIDKLPLNTSNNKLLLESVHNNKLTTHQYVNLTQSLYELNKESK